MSDDETRQKRNSDRKRNRIARELRLNRAFLPKVIDKPKYVREKLSVRNINESDDDESN